MRAKLFRRHRSSEWNSTFTDETIREAPTFLLTLLL